MSSLKIEKETKVSNNNPPVGCDETEEEIDMIEEEDEIDDEDEDYDYEISDAIVQPADGVLTKYRDDEVCLLFFYTKPGMGISDKKIVYKGVAEFRIATSKFMKIAENIQDIAQSLKKTQNNDFGNNFMFA